MDLLFCLFVALRLKTTAMVIAGRSVHLAHFFLGKLEQAVNQYFVHVLLIVTDNNLAEGRRMTVDIISWSISTKSIRQDRDPTPDSWICRQTRICCQTLYRLCYSARIHYLNPYPATIFLSWKCCLLLVSAAYVFKCTSDYAMNTMIRRDQSKSGCKDQKSIQSSTTFDPGYQWESDKLTVKHHKWEPRGQPFPSRWPQGTYKQTHTKDP